MKKGLFRKGMVLGIILLFIGAGIIPSTVGIRKEKTQIQTIKSGGYIQGLIDNASDGDTIYIPSGTYYENIVINISISLIGEDKNTTIIDGNYGEYVLYLKVDMISISNFTIKNSGSSSGDAGIRIYNSNFNTITNNIILKTELGISLLNSNNNIIAYNCIFDNSRYGIRLGSANNNSILKNNISTSRFDGIHLWDFNVNNTISENLLHHNNLNGISLYDSDKNIITKNVINSNVFGGICIHNELSNNNLIFYNNLIDNFPNAIDYGNNSWDNGKKGNFWDDYEEYYPNATKLPFKGIWDTPYDMIEYGQNEDYFPLIKQWSDSRTRATFHPMFYYIFERFPLLERLLSLLLL